MDSKDIQTLTKRFGKDGNSVFDKVGFRLNL
jgi:hypothetical protein